MPIKIPSAEKTEISGYDSSLNKKKCNFTKRPLIYSFSIIIDCHNFLHRPFIFLRRSLIDHYRDSALLSHSPPPTPSQTTRFANCIIIIINQIYPHTRTRKNSQTDKLVPGRLIHIMREENMLNIRIMRELSYIRKCVEH